jgi:hypothetical protein
MGRRVSGQLPGGAFIVPYLRKILDVRFEMSLRTIQEPEGTITRLNEVADATGATRGLLPAAWFHVGAALLSDNRIRYRA